ncbi:MAG: hypothetical protein ABSB19_07790 [Methylomonas sp.]|jgi:hypothetical protein
MKIKLIVPAVLLFLSALSQAALAYDGQVSGQINMVEGATAANGGFPFVVTLKNSPTLCNNANTSAYLLSSDANYRVNTSILLTAKSLGSTVVLSSNQDANGYCQIMAFTIQ